MSVLQNFYREDIAIKLGTGTVNMYVSGLPTVTQGWLVINPKHPTQREIIKYNGTGSDGSGDYITIIERGVGGTTEQEHEVGEPVRMNITAEHWAELVAIVGSALVAADLDIDPNMGNDPSADPVETPSDTKIATQKAVFTFVKAIEASLNSSKVNVDGAQTVNGIKTFTDSPVIPAASEVNHPVTLQQLQSVVLAGAALASQSLAGLVKTPTDAQANLGEDADAEGNPLYARPSDVQKAGILWSEVKNYKVHDIVNYIGNLYKAIGASNNIKPDFFIVKKTLAMYSQNGYVVTEAEAGNAGDIRSSCFSSDGLYFYTLSTSAGRVSRFKLTTPYDLKTKSAADQTVDLSSNDTSMWGIQINSDGTRLYLVGSTNDKVYQFNLATAYSITGLTTADSDYLFPYYSPNPYDLFITPDDMKLFVVDYSTHDITELDFGTAGEVSTLSFEGQRFYTGAIEATEAGFKMSTDGLKAFFGGSNGDKIYQCTLTTAFDLSTMTYDNIAFSVAVQATSMYDVTFSTDGTKMYVLNSNRIIYQYTLSTAWNVATASYDSVQIDVTAQDSGARSITFSSNGLRMYMVGTTNDIIFQYNLATAWAMNTATYSGNSFSVSAQEANPYALAIADDGLSIYVAGNLRTIFRYTLSTANEINTASYTSSSGVIPDLSNLLAMDIATGGNAMYLVDQSGNNIYQINLTTAYDSSDYTTRFGGYYVVNNPECIRFSGDGKTMYLTRNGAAEKYELATAYDLSTIFNTFYTRASISDPWVATTSKPSVQSYTNFSERGFYYESPYDDMTLKRVKFAIQRLSGSSGGTNQGTVTFRLYELDSEGVPNTTVAATATELLTDLYNTSPAREYELTFDNEVDLGTDKRFFMSIEWNTDDADTLVFSNIYPVAVSVGGVAIDLEELINTDSLGNLNIVEVSPNRDFIYAANTAGILVYDAKKIESIYWAGISAIPGEIIPYYQDAAFTSWTSPVDGFLNVSFFGSSILSHNGVAVAVSSTSSSNTWNGSYAAPVKKGDVITHSSGTNSYLTVRVNA